MAIGSWVFVSWIDLFIKSLDKCLHHQVCVLILLWYLYTRLCAILSELAHATLAVTKFSPKSTPQKASPHVLRVPTSIHPPLPLPTACQRLSSLPLSVPVVRFNRAPTRSFPQPQILIFPAHSSQSLRPRHPATSPAQTAKKRETKTNEEDQKITARLHKAATEVDTRLVTQTSAKGPIRPAINALARFHMGILRGRMLVFVWVDGWGKGGCGSTWWMPSRLLG